MSATRGKARSVASSSAEEPEQVKVIAEGLPAGTTLGDLEGLVQSKVTSRITAISLQGDGRANIEFGSVADAEACLGEHTLMGATVRLMLPDESSALGKRTRPEADGAAIVTQPLSSVVDEVSSPPLDSDAVMGPPSCSSSSGSGLGSGYDGAALVVASSATKVLDPAPVVPTLPIMATDDEYEAPAAKRQRAETKKEKEKRLNRVGLSYRCGRCGLPKKGHVCIGTGPGEGGADAVSVGGSTNKSPLGSDASETALGSGGASNDTPPGGSWDLDSDSIFKDIKSVLQTPTAPMAAPAGGKAAKAGKAANANGKASGGSKRAKAAAKNMPPPPVMAEVASRSELLEELDFALQRPPSVITPEDGEGNRAPAGGPGSLGVAPSSLVSATDMFSPGQLMTHLLGTPTPAITPGLSPGTLNELGNMLQSPGAALASAKKVQEAAAEATGILAGIETPGP